MSFYKIFISLQKNFKIVVMKISPDASVGEVVKINFKTASIFQKNNIDFCCGGDKTISEACINAGLDTDQLIGQLETIAEQIDADSQYINDLSLEELSTYKGITTMSAKISPQLRRILKKSVRFMENIIPSSSR